jgi:hypothetical protein
MAQEQFESCIEACNACAIACEHCATACLGEQDVAALARCISLDIDCAQMCRMAASFMARGSAQALALCGLCADACDACAQECGQHPMEHCRDCASACQRCAKECRSMAGSARMGLGQREGQRPTAH